MKTRIITFLMFVCGLGMQAQGVRWGVEGGYNLSHSTEATGWKSGFNIGVTAEYGLSGGWYLDGALKLSSKPTVKDSSTNIYFGPDVPDGWSRDKVSATPYYLELPVRVGYKFGITDGCKLFVAAGPYVGVGLWGSGKWLMEHQNEPGGAVERSHGKIGNVYDSYMRRMAYGANARVGVEFGGHLQVSLGYDLQLNSYRHSRHGEDHNQVMGINVGWKF